MSLLVTGSIGIDTVEAPSGKVEDVLGGSSVYFAYAASFFGAVRFVGVVGEDCPKDFLQPLHDNPEIDMAGLEVRTGSKTFRWHGRYHDDINERDTIGVELNVLAEAGPKIPEVFHDSQYVFLANTHPGLQMEILGQLSEPKLVVADTMDLWINGEQDALKQLMTQLDGLVLASRLVDERVGSKEVGVGVVGERTVFFEHERAVRRRSEQLDPHRVAVGVGVVGQQPRRGRHVERVGMISHEVVVDCNRRGQHHPAFERLKPQPPGPVPSSFVELSPHAIPHEYT